MRIERKKPAIVYWMTGALFMLWQTASWLMTEHHALAGNNEIYPLLFMLYSLSGAAGLLLGSLVCDGILKIKAQKRVFAAIVSVCACVLTVLRFFTGNTALFCLLLCLASLSGFAAHSVLLCECYRKIPYAMRALCMGCTLSLSVFLRFPADIFAETNAEHAGIFYLLLAVLSGLVLAGLLLFLPLVRQVFIFQVPEEQEKKRPDASRLIWFGIFCSLFVYTLHGLFDASVNGTFVYSYVLLFRMLQVIIPLLVGFLCYRFGYAVSLAAGLCLSGMSALCYYFAYENLTATIFAMLGMAALHLFMVPLRAVFADLSYFSKYPSLVTSLGLITFFLFQSFGWPISSLLQKTGREIGFVIYICIFMLAIPVMLLFYNSLVHSYRKKTEPGAQIPSLQDLRSLHFTRREEEIFLLILKGLPMEEIAQTLFLSAATVKWHLSNILKKTETKNRLALIAKYKAYSELD